MNESSNAKTMYEAVPAVAELNKVPDFDPLKFLRRTKDSMRLDLPYQKLWFRMAHPNGRMRVTALRITEQMAIFEARVFLDRSDAEPFSMSVAQQQLQDNRDFIRGAQNEALSQALTDAGFGIQLISADAQAAVGHKKADATEKKAASLGDLHQRRNKPQRHHQGHQKDRERKTSLHVEPRSHWKGPQKRRREDRPGRRVPKPALAPPCHGGIVEIADRIGILSIGSCRPVERLDDLNAVDILHQSTVHLVGRSHVVLHAGPISPHHGGKKEGAQRNCHQCGQPHPPVQQEDQKNTA